MFVGGRHRYPLAGRRERKNWPGEMYFARVRNTISVAEIARKIVIGTSKGEKIHPHRWWPTSDARIEIEDVKFSSARLLGDHGLDAPVRFYRRPAENRSLLEGRVREE